MKEGRVRDRGEMVRKGTKGRSYVRNRMKEWRARGGRDGEKNGRNREAIVEVGVFYSLSEKGCKRFGLIIGGTRDTHPQRTPTQSPNSLPTSLANTGEETPR